MLSHDTASTQSLTTRPLQSLPSTVYNIHSIGLHVYQLVSCCHRGLPSRRLVQLRLLVLMLSILLENLEQFVAVWLDEFAERLKQWKHHVIDEAELHIHAAQTQYTTSKQHLAYETRKRPQKGRIGCHCT